MQAQSQPEKFLVFNSYSHKDERHRERLEKSLASLMREGILEAWNDRKITAGTEWEGAIDANLEAADVIILLVSPDFMSSNYCYDKEVARALERHNEGSARVIPVIVRPTDWHNAPFGKLQALPKDGKAITNWSNRDSAWVDVSRGIRSVCKELAQKKSP